MAYLWPIPTPALISDILTCTKSITLDSHLHLGLWFPDFLNFWVQLNCCSAIYFRPLSIYSLYCSTLHIKTINSDPFWPFQLPPRLLLMPKHLGFTRVWCLRHVLHIDKWDNLIYFTLPLAMLSGRCPLWNSKPGQVNKVEMFYLLQFFQLRKHTCLPDDLPSRELALGCDVPSVATATGKRILVVFKPKSKGNAITLN